MPVSTCRWKKKTDRCQKIAIGDGKGGEAFFCIRHGGGGGLNAASLQRTGMSPAWSYSAQAAALNSNSTPRTSLRSRSEATRVKKDI